MVEQNRDGQVAALLRSTLDGTLVDRLVSVPHYNGTPIAAENIVRPILDWEKNPAGLGWPTGHVEADPPTSPTSPNSRPNERTATAESARRMPDRAESPRHRPLGRHRRSLRARPAPTLRSHSPSREAIDSWPAPKR